MRMETLPEVTLAEKLFVNWALLPDALFYAARSCLTHDEHYSQSFSERCEKIWDGRVTRYRKLMKAKQDNGGEIPERYSALCRKSPCGYTRLLLAYML